MISVDSLCKSFGSIKAVDNISFSVSKGEILGFLGPNGAGKSTTMKMITTFLPPTSGRVTVDGTDTSEDPVNCRKMIGYLPESAPSYKDMKVYDFLSFAAEIRGYDGEERTKKVVEIIELCNLKEVAWQLIDTLSKGYRQRVGFAIALIHDPDYLVLDEPTDGLDPNQKQEVRSLIKNMGQEKCIILSTHILEEVEAVCSRAIIISSGQIVADDTPENLKKGSSRHGAVTLHITNLNDKKALDELKKVKGVSEIKILDESPDSKSKSAKLVVFPKKGASIAVETARFIHERKWNIEGFSLEQGDLNEVFYKLTKENKAA